MHSAFCRVLSPLFALLVFTMAASAQPSRAPSLTIASPASVEAGLAESKNGKILVVVMDSHVNSPNLWVAWNDATVKEWIANNATCLRYERGSYNPQQGDFKALESVDHGVVAFRNGEIYDRDTSFATAADLLEWLKRVKEGTITAEYARARAGERLDTTPSETRVILAERLDRVGDTAGADAEYAWLIERQLSRQRGRSDERYMPQSNWIFPNLSPDANKRGIAHLKADKDAVARLAIIRDKAATDAETNPDDRAAIVAWFGVQQIVPDLPRIVAWYERISKGTAHASQAKQLWSGVFLALVNAGDWATAGRIMDRPLGKLGVHTMRAEAIQMMGSEMPNETGPIVAREGDAASVYWGSMYYAALLAADRETDARLIAETLIEYSNRPITHRSLVRMALQAKEPREIHRDWADIADSNEKTIEKIRPEVDEALKAAAK